MKNIGSYQIVEKLEQAATYTLYVGQDAQRTAMIRLSNTPEWNEQVMAKGAALASVRHPAVVEIYEQGTQRENAGTLAYFAAEWVEGEVLAELMERHGEIPLKEKLELLIKLCEGVHALNGAGHVCLCTPDDVKVKDGAVKITDVHAKLPQFLHTSARVIQKGMKRIPFWSPEVISGTKDRDRREDVFALGLLTYVFVSGQDPYKAVNPIERAQKVLNEMAPPLCGVATDCPAALEATVKKSLKKDRELRQQTVREFGAELRLAAVNL